MRKIIYIISLFIFTTLFIPKSAYASLVTISKDGEVIENVLADSDSTVLNVPKTSFDVKKVAEGDTNDNVYLTKNEGKISMVLSGGKTLDVTNWKEDLVEVEERGDTKKLNIFLENGLFNIKQGSIVATTEFPITINPKDNRFSLETPSGEKYLAILPDEAVNIALRAKTVTEVYQDKIAISEENKDLCYVVAGKKNINLFNVYNLGVEVTAKISASTGEIVGTDEPVWMKVISLLTA